jgi:hypothetical protein
MKTKSESQASVKNIHRKKIWAYSSRKQSWQKLKYTLENKNEKKLEHIRSQVKSVQTIVKQRILGASKNKETRKKWKKKKKKRNKEILLLFSLY